MRIDAQRGGGHRGPALDAIRCCFTLKMKRCRRRLPL